MNLVFPKLKFDLRIAHQAMMLKVRVAIVEKNYFFSINYFILIYPFLFQFYSDFVYIFLLFEIDNFLINFNLTRNFIIKLLKNLLLIFFLSRCTNLKS